MKKLNKKGFTLIEIIVVVVVLAVLMAVAVPSVLKYVNEADNAKYMAQGRSVMNIAQTEVVKAYVGDNKITTDELTSIVNAIKGQSNKDGMGEIKADSTVTIYTKATVSEDNGTIVIAEGAQALTGSNTVLNAVPTIAAVECTIDNHRIVAVPNGKIFVQK